MVSCYVALYTFTTTQYPSLTLFRSIFHSYRSTSSYPKHRTRKLTEFRPQNLARPLPGERTTKKPAVAASARTWSYIAHGVQPIGARALHKPAAVGTEMYRDRI